MSKIKSLVLVGVASMFILPLCACNKDSSSNGDNRTSPDSSSRGSLDSIGEVKEITSADGSKISAICPKNWNDFSDQTSSTWKDSLYFSKADAPGNYSEPYFLIKYSDIANQIGGEGEGVSIESDGVTWRGLYNSNYKSFNITTVIDGGASVTLMSIGMDEEDAIFKAVLSSIKVTK